MVTGAPVLTLWASVVAEVLAFEHDKTLTLGRAVAGLNAYSKGVSPGLFQPTPMEVNEQCQTMRKEETGTTDLLHRATPAKLPPGARVFFRRQDLKSLEDLPRVSCGSITLSIRCGDAA